MASQTKLLALAVLCLASALPAWAEAPPESSGAAVQATTETPAARGDADDPAIWVHPTDPELSLVIGTDKDQGLAVYDLDGRELQFVNDSQPNNVDLRGDVVVAADDSRSALLVYRVDPAARRLEPVGEVAVGIAGSGLCLYRDPAGTLFAFANADGGGVEQWQLDVEETGVAGTLARQWNHGGEVEGCVADDRTGTLYLSEESKGIWRYGAGPADPTETPALIDSTNEGRLVPDVEGLAIARMENIDVLIASSQGDSHFVAYALDDHRFVGRFRVEPATVDGCDQTDGIDVTTTALGSAFPQGLFVCHDGFDEQKTNFKYAPLERVTAMATGQTSSG